MEIVERRSTVMRLWLLGAVLCLAEMESGQREGGFTTAEEPFLARIFTPSDYCVLSGYTQRVRDGRGVSDAIVERDVKSGRSGSQYEQEVSAEKRPPCSPPQSVAETVCSMLPRRLNHTILSQNFPQTLFDIPVTYHSPSSYQSLLSLSLAASQYNSSNRMLALIGDSITRNTMEALYCIFQRENDYQNVSLTPALYGNNKIHKKGGKLYKYQFPDPETLGNIVTLHVFYYALWSPLSGKMNNMSKSILKDLDDFVFSELPNVKVTYVFNIGIHEYPKHLLNNLKRMFNYSYSLLALGKEKNSFLYREISAQHYNLTQHNPYGYYHSKTMKKSRSLKKLMRCVPLKGYSPQVDPRHASETKAALEAGVNTIPFRNLSGHYFDLKLGGEFFSHFANFRTSDDCTHLMPAAAPTAYRILWLNTFAWQPQNSTFTTM